MATSSEPVSEFCERRHASELQQLWNSGSTYWAVNLDSYVLARQDGRAREGCPDVDALRDRQSEQRHCERYGGEELHLARILTISKQSKGSSLATASQTLSIFISQTLERCRIQITQPVRPAVRFRTGGGTTMSQLHLQI